MEKKNVLILGTASHVGKSSVVTALCRILSRKYRVAPFKAQNMSLNSWITKDGKEIGIAQAIQAKAAGSEPTADMNPVLLKPKGDFVSQIILLGEPYSDKSAGQYYDSISEMNAVLELALERLSVEYDIIVMEGAGAAAEINLYGRDIVNVGTARLTQAPIILVGDIERGGVFSSLYGTVALLPEDVQKNVKGFIINKFRGDMEILKPGLKQLEEKTGIPVLGVLPYFKLHIPSEDSVSLADKKNPKKEKGIEIIVINLPRISNFTDFEPLEELANIRYVNLHEELGTPDAIIIPGTKNTVNDLIDLKASGMAEKIKAFKGKIPIFGICGGYQIMGKTIFDSGVENGIKAEFKGLGLLDVVTKFGTYKKKTIQVTKIVNPCGPILTPICGEEIKGYEIHMGITDSRCSVFGDDGAIDKEGLVIGTYIHGLFENKNIRDSLMQYLYKKKGLEFMPEDVMTENDAYDELANFVERNLDMKKINKIIGI
jgi:adenosylcobyric acid synthase